MTLSQKVIQVIKVFPEAVHLDFDTALLLNSSTVTMLLSMHFKYIAYIVPSKPFNHQVSQEKFFEAYETWKVEPFSTLLPTYEHHIER